MFTDDDKHPSEKMHCNLTVVGEAEVGIFVVVVVVVVVLNIYPPVTGQHFFVGDVRQCRVLGLHERTGQRQTPTIGQFAHFSLQ